MTVISGTKEIVLENGLRIRLKKMAKPNAFAQYFFEILEKSAALGSDVIVARGRIALQTRVWIKPNRMPNPANKNARDEKDYIDDPAFPAELTVYGKDSLNSQIQDGIIEALGASIICENDIEPVDLDEAKAEEKAEESAEDNGGMGHDLDTDTGEPAAETVTEGA